MGGHIAYGLFLLILAFLVLSRYTAANTLIGTSASNLNTYTRTLQGH